MAIAEYGAIVNAFFCKYDYGVQMAQASTKE
jgi:hypothetical protein